jgi:hypothetical protein
MKGHRLWLVAIENDLPDPRTAFSRKSESSYSVRAISNYWLWRFRDRLEPSRR